MTMRISIAVLIALQCLRGAAAWAGVTAIRAIQVPQGVLPNHAVNDLLVDFTGNLRGQRLIVELTEGSVFQHAGGSTIPPLETLVDADASLAHDTFTALGGAVAETSSPLLDVTCTSLGLDSCPRRFDVQAIYIAWAPATGVDIPAGADFLTARMTLSNDARGAFSTLR